VKLGTVQRDGAARVAVAVDDQRAVLLDPGLTMRGLIGDWAGARPAVQRVTRAVGDGASATWNGYRRCAPGKVICIALNNSVNADRIISGPTTRPPSPSPPARCSATAGRSG